MQRYGIACDAFSTSLNVLRGMARVDALPRDSAQAMDDVVPVAEPGFTANRPPIDNLALIVALETGACRLISFRQEVAP